MALILLCKFLPIRKEMSAHPLKINLIFFSIKLNLGEFYLDSLVKLGGGSKVALSFLAFLRQLLPLSSVFPSFLFRP